jgi:hypothetical protein
MDQADELRKKAGTDNPSAFDIARVSGVTGSAAPEAKEFVSNLEKEATLKNQQDLKDETVAAQKDAADAKLAQEKQLREAELQARKDIASTNAQAHQDTFGLTQSTKEEQQQDKLEQQYMQNLQRGMKTQAYTLQNAKVEQAIHVRQAMESGRDENGQLHLNQVTEPEVALGLANLVSNKSTTNLEEFRSMTPQARITFLKRAMGDFFGKPVDVLTPDWTNTLLHMVDRQGLTAEKLRDNTLAQYKKFKNTRLAPERAANAESVSAGTNYSDFFGVTPNEKESMLTPSAKQVGVSASSADAEAAKKKYGISY